MAKQAKKPTSRRWLWSIIAVVVLVAGIGGAAVILAGPSAQKYLAEGVRQLEAGEVKSAVISLKNAVRSDPENAEARLALARASLRVGDPQSAEKEARAAQRLGASEVATLDLLGQSLFAQNKSEEILREIAPGSRSPEAEAVVRVWRGYAYLLQRDRNLARNSFSDAIRLNEREPRGLVGLARTSIDAGNLKQAEEEIDRALATAPKQSEALALKGELQRLSGRKAEAKQSFDAAIAGDSRNILALVGRAILSLDAKQEAQAEADARAVLAVAPAHPIGNYIFALLHARRNELKVAAERLERLGSGVANYPPSLYLLAALQYRLNQHSQAESNFERYLAIVPRDLRARQLAAELYMRRNANERAIDVLKLAVDTGAEDATTFTLLAAAYLRDRQFQEASKWFDKAAALPQADTNRQLQLAYGRFQLGQSEEAIREIEEALEQDPNSIQARLALALGHLRARDFPKALQAAEDLRVRQPDNPMPLNVIGTIHAARGALADARAAFEAAVKLRPDFVPARLNLAMLEAKTGNTQKAVESYKAIIEKSPTTMEAYMGLAQIGLTQNNLADAIGWLERAREKEPKALQPAILLIDLFMRDGKPDKALQVARDLQGRLPDNASALDALARAQLATGETASAIQTFRQVITLTPRAAEAHYRLGKALQQGRDEVGANAAFKQAMAVDTNYAPALLELIEHELRTGRKDAAEKMAVEWAKPRPNVVAAHVVLGDTYARVGKFREAADAFQRAHSMQPQSPIVIRLSNAYVRLGEHDKAVSALQRWTDQQTEDRVARFALADLLLSLRRLEPALTQYEILVKDEPKNPVILNNIAWIYGERNDPRAIAMAEEAVKNAPNSPLIIDTLGYLLVQKGDVKKGVEHLRLARSKAPTSAEIAYHLAVGLAKLGEKEEAKSLLKEVAASKEKFVEAPKAEQLLKDLGG